MFRKAEVFTLSRITVHFDQNTQILPGHLQIENEVTSPESPALVAIFTTICQWFMSL